MPNSQLFSCRFRVIILWKFFNLCLVSSFSLLISFDFCSYPFIGNSRETSLYYYWKVAYCLAGYFTRIFPNPLHYIWTLTNHFVGVFLKIFYTPSLLLESFKPFVGVFLKKFIKFSHKTGFISLVISFILRNSVCTCFLTIFLSYNCYYEKYSDGSVKNIQDEIPFDLPDSWSWERLSNLAAFSGGKTPSTSNRDYWGCNILWVTSKDMKSKYIDSSLLMISEKSLEQMQLYPENTLLLVTRSGILRHTIPVAILKKPATINQDLKAIMPYALNLGEYIYICIKGMESRLILEYTKAGATVENINFDAFQKILLPIPPENQIQRIVLAVNKVDEIIVKLKIDQDDLIDIIGKTKSKILELAIQGKLVPQDENDEPASALLERIRAERKAKLGKKYVESYIYKGDDNCYYEKIGKNSIDITENISFEIPSTWEICRLESIVEMYTGNSINESDKAQKYTGLSDGYNYIATKDISFNHIVNYENGIKIPFDEPKFKIAYTGDPLLCIEGGSAGRKIAILSEDVCFVNKLCVFHSLGVNKKYLYYYLQSPQFCELFKKNTSGLIGGVSINTLKSLYFMLPPLSEQLRIVCAIEEVFSYINEIEKSLV